MYINIIVVCLRWNEIRQTEKSLVRMFFLRSWSCLFHDYFVRFYSMRILMQENCETDWKAHLAIPMNTVKIQNFT